MKIAARKPRKLESSRLAFSLNLVLLNQEPGREASERGTDLLLSKDGSSSFHALLGGRRTEDVFSGSSFSYQTLDPKPHTRRRLALSLNLVLLWSLPRTGPRSWTKDEGRVFDIPLFMIFSEDGGRWTFFQALLTKNLDAKRRNEEQIF